MKRVTLLALTLVLIGLLGAATTASAKTLTYKGSGDRIVKLAKPSGKQGEAVVATITYGGASNFAVWTLNKKLKQEELLVNTIGKYKGTVPIDFQGRTVTYRLQIAASGSWKVVVKSLSSVRKFKSKIAGRGDDVVLYAGGPRVANIKHKGESNFAIVAYNKYGMDLLVNVIGNYKGQQVLPDAAYLAITAARTWSIVAK